MTNLPDTRFNEVILNRVCGEFMEMPGLRLTAIQAQRLWGLDQETCTQLLEHLVNAKFLSRSTHGSYSRTTDGPWPFPRPRMAKAEIEPVRPVSRKAV
jgi:hypothetical protein